MVCALTRAIMHSLTLVHHRYVHAHNHGISKTYETAFILPCRASFYSMPLDPRVHAREGGGARGQSTTFKIWHF